MLAFALGAIVFQAGAKSTAKEKPSRKTPPVPKKEKVKEPKKEVPKQHEKSETIEPGTDEEDKDKPSIDEQLNNMMSYEGRRGKKNGN